MSQKDDETTQLYASDESLAPIIPTNDNESGRRSGRGLSLVTATVFIVGEVAGGGILTLPRAMAGAGWFGVPLIILCCLCSGVAGVCLAKSWLILEERWPEYRVGLTRKPFATIGYRAYGQWMSSAVSVAMNVTRFGAGTVFLLLTAELVQGVTQSLLPTVTHCDWVPIVGVALSPLVLLGSPADFWPVAYTAMISTLIGSVLLLASLAVEESRRTAMASFSMPTFNSFFLSFGNILFAFGGASAFPNFQNDMREKHKFPKAVTFGFAGLLLLYLPVAIGGYVVYGQSVSSNILANITVGWLATIIEACFAVHCFFVFLIVINPVLLELEELFNIPKHFGINRCVFRIPMMCALIITGLTVPDFGKILNLIGGSSVTLMAFIMPPAFYYKLCSETSEHWPQRTIPTYMKVILLLITLVGVFGGIASTYSSIQDWITGSSLSLPCYIQNK